MVKMSGRKFLTLMILPVALLHADQASASQVPQGWEVKDAGAARKFLDLLKVKEKYGREKNFVAYSASLPRFLRAQLANQAKTLGWDESATAQALQRSALQESDLQKLDIIGFRQENLTTALVLQRRAPAAGQSSVIVQLFYLENSSWKIGERMELQKSDKNSIATELRQVKFYKTLPDAPAAIAKVELNAMYDVGAVAKGLKLDWSVNGVKQASVNMTSASGLLIGGLRKGRNLIEVNVTKDSDAARDINISINLRPEVKSIEELQRTKPYVSWIVQTAGKSSKEFEVR